MDSEVSKINERLQVNSDTLYTVPTNVECLRKEQASVSETCKDGYLSQQSDIE